MGDHTALPAVVPDRPANQQASLRIHINTDQDLRISYFEPAPLTVSGAQGRYVIEHRFIERGSLPAHTFDEHVLMLPLGAHAVRFQSRLNGRRLTGLIEPGRFRFLPRGDSLATSWDGLIETYFLTLSTPLLVRALGESAQGYHRDLVARLMPHDNRVLAHLLHALHAFGDGASLGGRLLEQTLLSAIAQCVMAGYSAQRRCEPRNPVLQKRKAQKLMDYVHGNLGRELYLHELAAIVEMSPYQLARAFRTSTGRSLWKYVLECRAQRSVQLMAADPDRPLSDVAADCGFVSYSQFIAAFRAVHGMLPREYRSLTRR